MNGSKPLDFKSKMFDGYVFVDEIPVDNSSDVSVFRFESAESQIKWQSKIIPISVSWTLGAMCVHLHSSVWSDFCETAPVSQHLYDGLAEIGYDLWWKLQSIFTLNFNNSQLSVLMHGLLFFQVRESIEVISDIGLPYSIELPNKETVTIKAFSYGSKTLKIIVLFECNLRTSILIWTKF